MSKQIVVIGAGPAGIEAAKAAAAAGGRVSLVSDSPLGGRAAWHSLLPSKVWLTAADTAGLLAEAATVGLVQPAPLQANPPAILARIKAVARRWSERQVAALQALNVELISGVASFEAAGEVAIKANGSDEVIRLRPAATIIAAGSVPFFPPQLKPDGQRVLAPRFAGQIESLPRTVVVIGAGPTGSEFVYLFNQLGVQVTWIVDQFGVLPAFAPEAGRFLAETLVQRGVKLVANQLADYVDRTDEGVTVVTSAGERHQAEMAFVAIGRQPDLSRLNLAAAGLALSPGQAPAVDGFGRTAIAGLYVVGDAAGPPMVANRGMAQAWVAGRHAAGAETAPFQPETVIYATYTEPQVAQVGLVAGDGLQTVTSDFGETLKMGLLPEGEGFVSLAYDAAERVTGAVAVGPHAAEVLAPVAVAIQQGATLADLAGLYGAYPTASELAFIAARAAVAH